MGLAGNSCHVWGSATRRLSGEVPEASVRVVLASVDPKRRRRPEVVVMGDERKQIVIRKESEVLPISANSTHGAIGRPG